MFLSQKGFARLVVILIIVIGIITGTYFLRYSQVFTPRASTGTGETTVTCTASGRICVDSLGKTDSSKVCNGTSNAMPGCPAEKPYCVAAESCSEPNPTCAGQNGVCVNGLGESANQIYCSGTNLGAFDCPQDRPNCVAKNSCIQQTGTICYANGGMCLDQSNKNIDGRVCSNGTHKGQFDCPDERPYCMTGVTCYH